MVKKIVFLIFIILIGLLLFETVLAESTPDKLSAEKALDYLLSRLHLDEGYLYVYKDFSHYSNHYPLKGLITGPIGRVVEDMNENDQEHAWSGSSAISCSYSTPINNQWSGWTFLNGHMPEGTTDPLLNWGKIDDAGYDLSGAERLTFMARGEKGGEIVECFTAGNGRDGQFDFSISDHPDSSEKQSLGRVTLTDEWKLYTIPLEKADLSYIACGFGFNIDSGQGGTFYLDEIRFEGDIAWNKGARRMLPSYETNIAINPDDIFVQNAAFTYDNALAALAFMSAGMQQEAKTILDNFSYAITHDRFYDSDRVRNAYQAGDIRPFPGWGDAVRLPNWYDNEDKATYEDQYQVGVNTGNTSWLALALLQYDRLYGTDEFLPLAETIMEWVLDECQDGTPGFTAGYDGWPAGDSVSLYTYKSIEHNIDAWAAFEQLYRLTGEEKYSNAAMSALKFIQNMYDETNRRFCVGTGSDGSIAQCENTVLDAQVWSALALGDEFLPYMDTFDLTLSMQDDQGGFPFHEAGRGKSYWLEGTAFTALTLRLYDYNEAADRALSALRELQLDSGAFPAASQPGLTTGIDLFTGTPWTYGTTPHVAPTAWYIMAVNGFNPYDFAQ